MIHSCYQPNPPCRAADCNRHRQVCLLGDNKGYSRTGLFRVIQTPPQLRPDIVPSRLCSTGDPHLTGYVALTSWGCLRNERYTRREGNRSCPPLPMSAPRQLRQSCPPLARAYARAGTGTSLNGVRGSHFMAEAEN